MLRKHLALGLLLFFPAIAQAFPADFDGDGRSDIIVYRPADFCYGTPPNQTCYSAWYLLPSSGSCPPHIPPTGWGYACRAQWGVQGDIPISGQFDGNEWPARADLTVVRGNDWYINFSNGSGSVGVNYPGGGTPDETDRNGDGISDMLRVVSASTVLTRVWDSYNRMIYLEQHVLPLGDPSMYTYPAPFTERVSANYGGSTPNAGDAAFVQKEDYRLALQRYRSRWVWNSWIQPYTGNWVATFTLTSASSDVWQIKPVVGHYTGDSHADYVWVTEGGVSSVWHYKDSQGAAEGIITVGGEGWGLPGDIYLGGDYDGDGTLDRTVWRPSTAFWYIYPSSGACPLWTSPAVGGGCFVQWGLAGDIPVG